MEFHFQSNFVKYSLKCPKTKSSTHCLTVLFLIYQNNNWTINGGTYNHTIFTSHHVIVLYWRFGEPLAFQTFNNHNGALTGCTIHVSDVGNTFCGIYCNSWVAMEKAWVWAFFLRIRVIMHLQNFFRPILNKNANGLITLR